MRLPPAPGVKNFARADDGAGRGLVRRSLLKDLELPCHDRPGRRKKVNLDTRPGHKPKGSHPPCLTVSLVCKPAFEMQMSKFKFIIHPHSLPIDTGENTSGR